MSFKPILNVLPLLFCAVGRPHVYYSKGSFSFLLIAIGSFEPLAQPVVLLYKKDGTELVPSFYFEITL